MALISDLILDNGLAYLSTNGNRLDICSQEPTTYAEATTTYTRGNKTALSIAVPSDRSPSGRECVIAEITDGSTTDSGGITHWAITNTVGSELLASGPIEHPYIVTTGKTFTLPAFSVGIPDAL